MSRIILLVALLLISLAGPNVYALSPLQNPGFEFWTGNSPDGWMVIHENTNSAYFYFGQNPDNKSRVKFTVGAGGNSGHQYTTYMYQHLTGAAIGQEYKFSMRNFGGIEFMINGGPSDLSFYVGIDPLGGTDPHSQNIAWKSRDLLSSGGGWGESAVQAVATNSGINVFAKFYNEGHTYQQPGSQPGCYSVFIGADDAAINVVPESSSFLLLGCGLFIIIYTGLRAKRVNIFYA